MRAACGAVTLDAQRDVLTPPTPRPPPALASHAPSGGSGKPSAYPPPSVEELRKTAAPAKGPESREADQGYVPDVDGMTGRARREAVFKRVYGEDLHDTDAKAFTEEGTRANPIPILSTEPTRLVGISLPDDAEIRWMELRKGELACAWLARARARAGRRRRRGSRAPERAHTAP